MIDWFHAVDFVSLYLPGIHLNIIFPILYQYATLRKRFNYYDTNIFLGIQSMSLIKFICEKWSVTSD